VSHTMAQDNSSSPHRRLLIRAGDSILGSWNLGVRKAARMRVGESEIGERIDELQPGEYRGGKPLGLSFLKQVVRTRSILEHTWPAHLPTKDLGKWILP